MPQFNLIVLDSDDNQITIETFNDLSESQLFAENQVDGSIFRIHELEPFLWGKGDYLRGERRFGGNIDWVRIPIEKEEHELC